MERWWGLLSLLAVASPLGAGEGPSIALQGAASFVLRGTLRWEGEWPSGGQAWLEWEAADSRRCRLVWDGKQARFETKRNGAWQGWGWTAPSSGPWEPPMEFVLQHQGWRWALLGRGRPMAAAYGGIPTSDLLFNATTSALRWENLHLQPTEPPLFTDDFMRTEEHPGAWNVLAGRWVNSVPNSARPDPRLSANPFAYRVASSGTALAVAGEWFWDAYSLHTSVRPTQGWVGIVAWYQDERNFVLLRWGQEGQGRLELILCQRGRWQVLDARPQGYIPRQWYRLTLRVCGSLLLGEVDGLPLLSAYGEGLGLGKIGLYAQDAEGTLFDDVEVEPWEVWGSLQSETPLDLWTPFPPSAWTVREDAWQAMGKEGALVTGTSLWPSGRLRVKVALPEKASPPPAVGLVWAWQGPQDYWLYRCTPEAQEVLQVQGGKARLVARTSGGYLPTARRLSLEVFSRDGLATVKVQGRSSWTVVAPTERFGPLGLWFSGSPGLRLEEWQVDFPEERRPRVRLTEQFTKEETMEGWASGKGAWEAPSPANGQMWWHKTAFFGNPTLRIPWRGMEGKGWIALATQRGQPQSGWLLEVRLQGDPLRVQGRLFWGRRVVASGEVEADPSSAELVLLRRDDLVAAFMGPRPLLSWRGEGAPSTPFIGLAISGAEPDLQRIEAYSDHLLDETFSTAPVNWYATKGRWEVTDRWICYPGWAWFGGSEDLNPILWSKDFFRGNLVLEFYAALKMDLREPPHYRHPSDINATLFGDGFDLGSGYSFLYNGWNNTRSAILRGASELASTIEGRFRRAWGGNFAFHRHWFYLRLERWGERLRFFVDDALLAEAHDPQPLEAGAIALWTYRNGLLLSRVRVAYEEARRGFLPEVLRPRREEGSSPPRQEQPHPLRAVRWEVGPVRFCDFERDTGEVWTSCKTVRLALDSSTASSGRSSLKVLNTTSGGEFSLRLNSEPVDVARTPLLLFDYRVPPPVRLNLFLEVRGWRYPVLFLGPEDSLTYWTEQATQHVEPVGRIPAKADGQWHRALFDLREALARIAERRGESVSLIEAVELAADPTEPYVLAGIGGNPWGAFYHLDNVGFLGPLRVRSRSALFAEQEPVEVEEEWYPLGQEIALAEPLTLDWPQEAGLYWWRGRVKGGEAERWLPLWWWPEGAAEERATPAFWAEYFLEEGEGWRFVGGRWEGAPNWRLWEQPPFPALSSRRWRARWSGWLTLPTARPLRLAFPALRGAVRLWVDGLLRLSTSESHSGPADVVLPLEAGKHRVEIEFLHPNDPRTEIVFVWREVP